ncbi:uncharacterized protein STEHIDRAFT_123176 [Stereum hirsutum FP-91666 SS1]|uniref:uncharacterized protein n=1 Tax=Stereum hirsutum (strain FP-91666) TaxID=721885 RepID=UPI0004449DBE|nr:uncharacterized protein STEHIDRAFT_123176 [Stereum hirsutum FP-91666 SS1]EIM84358.1 hypothetical protein STEHIDRAFT_123176 [Stereum hirsutum FP-91666 SS1]
MGYMEANADNEGTEKNFGCNPVVPSIVRAPYTVTEKMHLPSYGTQCPSASFRPD